MNLDALNGTSHRRYNPLTRDWILVSPHRNERPWQGQVEMAASVAVPQYDPACYLCPGNQRAGGIRNPKYPATFVFDNDFAALQPQSAETVKNITENDGNNLLIAAVESGICRVVCFTPRHNLTLAQMSVDDIVDVVEVWTDQYQSLSNLPGINYVQIFENRGALMGCSNPHPHGQIWATQSIPNEPGEEQESLEAYQREHRTCLLCDYMELEISIGERIVSQNDSFVAVVPFWATWPFETLVLSRQHVGDIGALKELERKALADILKRLTTRYDNLFQTSFPYSMGFHQRPTDGEEYAECHLHAHFYPPLLRSATVKKFMVGFELLASPQRDTTPELAALRLREVSERHYLEIIG